jgi:cytochrome c oxidase subunit III
MVVRIENSGLIEEPNQVRTMNPKKFGMWVFILTVVMLFAAFTSAYIVRKSAGDWVEVELPGLLWGNSVIILVSSITMHWAFLSAKRNNLNAVKLGLILTTFLGTAFLIMQFQAWVQLVENQTYWVGNPSGSFLYVLTGIHGLHIVGGIVFLIFVLNSAFKYKVHSKSTLQIELCTMYWHFLDGLWIYLFIFLLLNH